MNDDAPPSVDELISRHFDEALPSAEHQRLTAALDADVAARLYFVDTARLHAGLEALAPALLRVKKRYVGGWVLAGAAAALMLGGAVLFWSQPLRDQIRITLQDLDAVPDGKSEKPKLTGLAKRIVKSPAAALPAGAPALDVQELLSRYYVNVSPNGLTVPEALGQLEDAIKKVNILHRPELDQLSFVADVANYTQPFDPPVKANAKIPMTVERYLKICSQFRQIVQEPGGKRYGDPGFSVQYKGLEPKREKFLRDREESLRLMQKIDAERSEDAVKRSVWLKFITLDEVLLPAGFNENTGKIVSEDELRLFEGTLLGKSHPRMTDWMDGQTDRSERAFFGHIDTVGAFSSDVPEPEWSSVESNYEAQPIGELISVCGKILSEGWKVRSPNEKALGRKGVSDAEFNADRVGVCLPTEFEVWLQPKEIALIVLDSLSENLRTIACISVKEKQANSEEQDWPKNLVASEREPENKVSGKDEAHEMRTGFKVEGKSGFVTSPWAPEKGQVDVREIPSGSKVKCPYTGKVFLVP